MVISRLLDLLLSIDWQNVLELLNAVLASGIVIVSCAFLLYIVAYSSRNAVTRSFAGLLACVIIAYFVDLALFGTQDLAVATQWLRLQWLGIAFTPPAYLGFSNALLVTTGARNRWRELCVRISYVVSTLVLAAVILTDWIVSDAVLAPRTPHLTPGPLLPIFVLYFLAAVGWGTANVLWARQRCLTSTSRRRMTYLAVAFLAPAAGVFPYLLLTGWPSALPSILLWVLLVSSNIAIGLMITLLAYSVAFFGALTPDRVIKHRLVRFLLRGPLVATLVVVVIIASLQAEGWLGLSSRRLALFGVVAVILLLQLGIELAKPLIDRALYRQDQPEIEWLQNLSNRLLTTTDLRQFLENVLTALCDLLRVEAGFVVSLEDDVPHLEVVCGRLDRSAPPEELLPEEWHTLTNARADLSRGIRQYNDIFVWNGYWLFPLRSYSTATEGETKNDERVIGIVGVAARAPHPDLTSEEKAGTTVLLAQIVAALEDHQLQQRIFRALERMIPEIEDIQRRRGVMRYVGERALTGLSMAEEPEFRQWVRDALSHYWGGPKLSSSPLLGLRVVERAAHAYDDNILQGLRAVLKQAIESLRPAGQRQMTTPEWILYNILELKFLQGRRVREIAQRLAMSEADLYRKQRIAIEAVAQVLARMEQEELEKRAQPS